MAFCSRILAANISIIIFTSTPVLSKSTVNSTPLNSKLLLHIPNHFTNIHNLQTACSISVDERILNHYAVEKNEIRTKRPPSTNHSQHCYDHKLSCQPAEPRKQQVCIHKFVEEWINVVSLLDYSNITEWEQQVNNSLYINKMNLTQWIVNSSCPTKYLYHEKDLLVAQCACSHQDCHQVEVKVHIKGSKRFHPVGCVHAQRISVKATSQHTDIVYNK